MHNLYHFTAHDLSGDLCPLSAFAGQVVLIANTASKCDLTPQFDGLEDLYLDYQTQGFTILGFPCNQFANQEPGGPDETAEVCRTMYDTTFPMFGKINVNGKNAHPLYQWLKSEQQGVFGSAIKWNFTKFLVGRNGQSIGRYSPFKSPTALRQDIEHALRQPSPAQH